MIKRLLPLFLLTLLTSCATLFSKKTYEMEIHSNTYTKVKVYDSVFDLPAKVEVRRSKENLPMVFSSDTVSRTYFIQPSVKPGYLFGNLSFVHFAPVGYLVDLTNHKRYYYGKSILVNSNDSLTINTNVTKNYRRFKKRVHHHFTKEHETSSGQLYAIVGLPGLNSFLFKPVDEATRNSTGFLGIAGGLEYFYTENKFVGVYASGVMNFPFPVPAPVSYNEPHEFLDALTVGLTNNHKLNRFTLGYGLQYSKNTWTLSNNDDDEEVEVSTEHIHKKNKSLGLMANGYFQFTQKFFVGLSYKPSLLALGNTPKLNYEHVISLDFVWKFKIKG